MNRRTHQSRPDSKRRAAPWMVPVALITAGAPAGLIMWLQPEQPPTTRVIDCTEGGCHADTLAHEFLHGPTAVSACNMCHEYTRPIDHAFKLKSEGRELCDFCHINKVGTEGPVVHDPVAQGDCLSCHNPHGGATRKLMRAESVSAMCASCHEGVLDGTHLHEPAGTGDCLACHEVHTSHEPALLVMNGRTLCLSCHEAERTQIETAPHVHEPSTGDCLDCHTSHVSEHAGQLIDAPQALCLSCHDPILELATSSKFKHAALDQDRACLNCHQPHASTSLALQYDDPTAACLVCHKEVEHVATKKKVQDNPSAPVFFNREPEPVVKQQAIAPPVPDLNTRLAIAHGPVAEANCGACHGVHGAPHTRLLKQNYTNSFYEDYTPGAYALCFGCHDEELVDPDAPREATRFRDDNQNLHALHVNREQGRTCRACHTAHTSDSKAQIRKDAPFGQWRIPLNFKLTETGGSCAPGCHKMASYDRADPPEEPVDGGQ